MQIQTLSGFLGVNSDWNIFSDLPIHPIDYQNYNWDSLSAWTKDFHSFFPITSSAILMGYSLGGRLALHAVIDQPQRWKGAIIISSHPGLAKEEERQKRIRQDEMWAIRFEKEKWIDVIKDWNQQLIFAHTYSFTRLECNYERKKIAHCLRKSSLALQENLTEKIQNIPIPILWITGKKDNKYNEIGGKLLFSHPLSSHIPIIDAGHRAPWDQPFIFQQIVKEFLKKLDKQ